MIYVSITYKHKRYKVFMVGGHLTVDGTSVESYPHEIQNMARDAARKIGFIK